MEITNAYRLQHEYDRMCLLTDCRKCEIPNIEDCYLHVFEFSSSNFPKVKATIEKFSEENPEEEATT